MLAFFQLQLQSSSFAQKGSTIVGVQYKPIFPVGFLGTGKQSSTPELVTFDVELKSGYCAGMVIRHNFSELLALESGINYVKRKYNLTISDADFKGKTEFRIIGYEIPVNLLVYIQLGEKLFMKASMGPSLDMFASNV